MREGREGRERLSTDDIGLTGTITIPDDPELAKALQLPANNIKFRTFLSAPFQNRQIATNMLSRVIAGTPPADEMWMYGVQYWYVTFDRDIEDAWQFAAP